MKDWIYDGFIMVLMCALFVVGLQLAPQLDQRIIELKAEWNTAND